MNYSHTSYWDPTGREINPQTFAEAIAKLKVRYEKHLANPGRLRRFYALGIILLILGGLALLFFGVMQAQLLFIFALPLIYFLYQIRSLQTDLAKLAIANQFNWAYSPNEDKNRWAELKAVCPEIFTKGNRGQYIGDEFWGQVPNDQNRTPFWTGEFSYTVGQGKNSRTYHETVYAFQINRRSTADFTISPESSFSIIGNFFTKRDINLESAEFNSLFHISYRGQKQEIGQQVFHSLNPSVMAKLIDFRQNCGKFTLVFQKDTVLTSFPGQQLKLKHTNFLKEVALDPRDIEAIIRQLQLILSYAKEIA